MLRSGEESPLSYVWTLEAYIHEVRRMDVHGLMDVEK